MPLKKVTVEAIQGQLAIGRQEDDGPVVLLDRPADRPGGRGLGFNGGHLMMLGLGACFKSVLLAAAEERGIDVRSLKVTVTASEADGPFRYDALDIAVEIDADADGERLERLLTVAERGCQVSNTLRCGAAVRAALAGAVTTDRAGAAPGLPEQEGAMADIPEHVLPAEPPEGVEYYRADDDGRMVAVVVRDGFADYAAFPPFVETEAERAHIESAYSVADPALERDGKAHVTPHEWPLQVIMLKRDPSAVTHAHYHVLDGALPPMATRHQILICMRGALRVGVYTRHGAHVGESVLRDGDFIIMLEGHQVEFLEPGTKVIEVKQGPFPGSDAADKVDLKELAA
jgi:uncharacterized OsmC-like protein